MQPRRQRGARRGSGSGAGDRYQGHHRNCVLCERMPCWVSAEWGNIYYGDIIPSTREVERFAEPFAAGPPQSTPAVGINRPAADHTAGRMDEPKQPRDRLGISFLRGPLAEQWALVRDQTNLKRTPILGNEAMRKAAVSMAHAAAAQAAGAAISAFVKQVKGRTAAVPALEAAPNPAERPRSAPARNGHATIREEVPDATEDAEPESMEEVATGPEQPRPSTAKAAMRTTVAIEEPPPAAIVHPRVYVDLVPKRADRRFRQPFANSARLMEERVRQRLRQELSRVTTLFHQLDSNRDGKVTRREFIRGLIAANVCAASHRDAIASVFDDWDVDRSGTLDYYELKTKLRKLNAPPPRPHDINPAQMTLLRPPPRQPIAPRVQHRAPPPSPPPPSSGKTTMTDGGERVAAAAAKPMLVSTAVAAPPPPRPPPPPPSCVPGSDASTANVESVPPTRHRPPPSLVEKTAAPPLDPTPTATPPPAPPASARSLPTWAQNFIADCAEATAAPHRAPPFRNLAARKNEWRRRTWAPARPDPPSGHTMIRPRLTAAEEAQRTRGKAALEGYFRQQQKAMMQIQRHERNEEQPRNTAVPTPCRRPPPLPPDSRV